MKSATIINTIGAGIWADFSLEKIGNYNKVNKNMTDADTDPVAIFKFFTNFLLSMIYARSQLQEKYILLFPTFL